MFVKKIPSDKCSICPLCVYYRRCSKSPVLVPYDKEIPLTERLKAFRAAVYRCPFFIDRITSF